MVKRVVRFGVLIAVGMILAACGAAETPTDTTTPVRTPTTAAAPTVAPATMAPTTASAPAETTAVAIKQFAFTPDTLEIKTGTTVLWTNSDDIEHSVTSSGGAFDSGFFVKDETFEFTFAEPGEYPYVCMRHASMTGKIVVTAP